MLHRPERGAVERIDAGRSADEYLRWQALGGDSHPQDDDALLAVLTSRLRIDGRGGSEIGRRRRSRGAGSRSPRDALGGRDRRRRWRFAYGLRLRRGDLGVGIKEGHRLRRPGHEGLIAPLQGAMPARSRLARDAPGCGGLVQDPPLFRFDAGNRRWSICRCRGKQAHLEGGRIPRHVFRFLLAALDCPDGHQGYRVKHCGNQERPTCRPSRCAWTPAAHDSMKSSRFPERLRRQPTRTAKEGLRTCRVRERPMKQPVRGTQGGQLRLASAAATHCGPASCRRPSHGEKDIASRGVVAAGELIAGSGDVVPAQLHRPVGTHSAYHVEVDDPVSMKARVGRFVG